MKSTRPPLRTLSFHSVKGGVGKSTLAAAAAAEMAARNHRVALVDFDLTGTSIADVLPLEAPDLARDAAGVLDLTQAPPRHLPPEESAVLLERRGFDGAKDLDARAIDIPPRHVPLLNDYLLYSPRDEATAAPRAEAADVPRDAADAARDITPLNVAWRWGPVFAFPSSALPADVARILPMVYDEEYGSFFEARLERFLNGLSRAGIDVVVFDSPPTIPGVSRSLLSLAIRLGSGRDPIALATDGFIPDELRGHGVRSRAFVVVSKDAQDIAAAARWLDLADPDDATVVRLLANRMSGDDFERVVAELQRSVGNVFSRSYTSNAVLVRDDVSMGLRHWDRPPVSTALLEALERGGVLAELEL